MGWSRFKALVADKVTAAAPEAAAAKERAAAWEHGISMPRVSEHGTASLTITADVVTIMGLHHAAVTGARDDEDSMPGSALGQRQVAALTRAAGVRKPRVKLYLHLGPDSPVARMEGHGPLTVAYVRHLLARHLDLHLGGDTETAGWMRVQPLRRGWEDLHREPRPTHENPSPDQDPRSGLAGPTSVPRDHHLA